jgi:PPOX class probable FMN-dependent enzyme
MPSSGVVSGGDPFSGAIAGEAELRELYDEPIERVVRKQIDHIDEMARRLIALAPIVFVASHDGAGAADVTPRGGPPGFVTVLDDGHLAIPDATGNRRIDTLRNVVATGQAGLIFVIPGRSQTLRVNGPARVSARADLLERLTAVGKPPRTALVVQAEEVYAHCPKAFIRSELWRPESWPSADEQPTTAEVSHAHLGGDDFMTVPEIEQSERDALKYRLA